MARLENSSPKKDIWSKVGIIHGRETKTRIN